MLTVLKKSGRQCKTSIKYTIEKSTPPQLPAELHNMTKHLT